MSRVREIFPTLENLVWRKHIQLTSPHEVKECVSKLEAADGTQVSSIKVATYISPYAPNDDIVRFAIKNRYGNVKVWGVGTLSRDQEEGVSIQVDLGNTPIK